MFVDTVALMGAVPEQTLRYRAVKAVGNNFCKDSLGRIVEILRQLGDSGLTRIQLRKSEFLLLPPAKWHSGIMILFLGLRYIELGPLPAESKEEKSVQWQAGGLLVLAKWQNGVLIEYADVFQCLESDVRIPNSAIAPLPN